MQITTQGLIRWSGLAAMAAGLIFAGIQPIHPADVLASVTTSFWSVIISLKLAMCLLFLIGITGIYARQAEKAGWLGFAGFALLIVSFWLQTGFVFVELLVLPVVATSLPGFVDSALGIANGQPGVMDIGAFVPTYGAVGIGYLLGGLLFGIATVRAGVLPRWPALLLTSAAIITPAAAMLPHALQRYAAVPMGIALIWIGFSLWSERGVGRPRNLNWLAHTFNRDTAGRSIAAPSFTKEAAVLSKFSSKPKSRLRLLWAMPVVALIGVGGVGVAAMMQPPPADLDLSLTQATEHGLYIGTLEPSASPVPVGPIQTWTIAVTTPDGQPLEHADLSIDGGMPQHGHGLPTEPQVTEELGGGRYRVEGMKFNMPGWWTIELSVSGAAGTDSATFNLTL